MTEYCATFILDSAFPIQGWDTLIGLSVLAGILITFLGLFYKVDKIRKEREQKRKADAESLEKEYADRLSKETAKIAEQIELNTSLRDLRDSNKRLSDSICALNESIRVKFDAVEHKVSEHDKQITEALASTSSAHKRIDEHRTVEHNIPNGRSNPNTEKQ